MYMYMYVHVCYIILMCYFLISVITANMSRLRSPPYVRHCSSVKEWLETLHLSTLEHCFEGYSLEKVSQLLEMQLLNVYY